MLITWNRNKTNKTKLTPHSKSYSSTDNSSVNTEKVVDDFSFTSELDLIEELSHINPQKQENISLSFSEIKDDKKTFIDNESCFDPVEAVLSEGEVKVILMNIENKNLSFLSNLIQSCDKLLKSKIGCEILKRIIFLNNISLTSQIAFFVVKYFNNYFEFSHFCDIIIALYEIHFDLITHELNQTLLLDLGLILKYENCVRVILKAISVSNPIDRSVIENKVKLYSL